MIQYEDGRFYRPAHPSIVFIEPMTGDGYTETGIKVTHHERLPRVFGLVIAVHPALGAYRPEVVPGAFVVFRQHACDEAETATGIKLYCTHVDNLRLVIDFADETGENSSHIPILLAV